MYHHPYETLILADIEYQARVRERDRCTIGAVATPVRRVVASFLLDLGQALVATSRRLARET